jgi:RNA polymerase sigma-70 factor (ECF subfamily)
MISNALPLPVPAYREDVNLTDDSFLRERFGALFRQFYPELCNFVVQYVRSRAVAEELVQDLFLRLWERRMDWKAELPSRSYLYQAVRNRALDHLKHERVVDRGVRPSLYSGDAAQPAVDEELAGQSLEAALRVAIEQLPDRTRQVFVLSRGHGLSYAQIADALDVSVKTVEAQMARAFRLLRDRLRSYL